MSGTGSVSTQMIVNPSLSKHVSVSHDVRLLFSGGIESPQITSKHLGVISYD